MQKQKFRIAADIRRHHVLRHRLRARHQLTARTRPARFAGHLERRFVSDYRRDVHPLPYFGYPAGLTIKAIGYKRTMSLSFIIFAVAFYLFILSADYKSFSLFLLASFISGAANAYLQASVNPYITILGPLESAAKRISIMGICNKLAWPIPSIFIVWLLGKDVNLIGIEDLNKPFIIIIAPSLPWASWLSSHPCPK